MPAPPFHSLLVVALCDGYLRPCHLGAGYSKTGGRATLSNSRTSVPLFSSDIPPPVLFDYTAFAGCWANVGSCAPSPQMTSNTGFCSKPICWMTHDEPSRAVLKEIWK